MIISTHQVLFAFVPNKQFRQLINISPHSLRMMNTVNTEFSSVEVWFTDQASKALEIENVNLILIIGYIIKMNHNSENTLKDMAFC